jgi:DNA-binding NtrC family response regulator
VSTTDLPRLLIIDDVFGRTVSGGLNEERRALCGQYLIEDITGDEPARLKKPKINNPIAEAVFFRGQRPVAAHVGDIVQNDLEAVLGVVQGGWTNVRPGERCWSLVLLDLCFYTGRVTEESSARCAGTPPSRGSDNDPSSYFGLEILSALHRNCPDLPVVILSSKPRDTVSLEFSSLGALGFIDRSSPRSPSILTDYLWRHGLIPDATGAMAGRSRPILFALRSARRAAANRRNLLMRGERGSGKELLAAYIHQQTYGDQSSPFVPVDSGTLDSSLYASALFGHKRGSFTGADRDRTGFIVEADGGDLFLDEIGNMPAEVQAGLLRVLQERKVVPLGDVTGRAVDARFLSATNEDIEGRAATGGFRPDLLDRLRQGGTVILPSLRERIEDLPLLVERFIREAEATVPGAVQRRVEVSALQRLADWHWPGNVRELRDCILAAVTNHPHVEFLVPAHLPVQQPIRAPRPITEPISPPHAEPATELGHDPIAGIATQMDDIDFSKLPRGALVGKLSRLHTAYARLVARYLKAILEATRRSTPANPEGEVRIHPAMRLMTGDQQLTASQASDLIKRLVRLDPAVLEEVLSDPLLAAARVKAQRLRPTMKRGSRGSDEADYLRENF